MSLNAIAAIASFPFEYGIGEIFQCRALKKENAQRSLTEYLLIRSYLA